MFRSDTGGLRVWRSLCQHSLDNFIPGEQENLNFIISEDARAGQQVSEPGQGAHAPLLLQTLGKSLLSREDQESHPIVLHISLYSGQDTSSWQY